MQHTGEAVVQKCSVKREFLEISQNAQENTCTRVSFLIKCSFIKKETLAQVFSREFCEISKNTFFTEHLRATASDKVSFLIHISIKFTQDGECSEHFISFWTK